jgi:hypothetical protein
MGKKLSLMSKAFSLVFVVTAFFVYVLAIRKLPTSDEVWGIVQIGIFVACVFVPVDLSLITENIKGKKNG